MAATRRKQVLRLLLFNLGLMMVVLLVLELVFGDWWHPNEIHHLNLVRDCVQRYEASSLYDGAGVVKYTRDKWGFRGAYPSLDDIDIITLGGSATDQRYITDGSTWQDVIAREFAAEGRKVSVVNAGVDGQSTFGHIKDLDGWFPAVPKLKIRYVLFYVGGNDMFKDIDSDFDDLVNHKRPTWKSKFKDRSAIYNALRMLRGMYEAGHVHRLTHRRADFASWTWTQQPLVADHEALVAWRLERYRKAIDLLAEKVHAMGAIPIFVGQSLSVYRRRPDGQIEGRTLQETYGDQQINGMDLYEIMHLFWKTTMEECAKANGVCIDAGNEIVFQPGDFYDAIHNTPRGTERLGKYLHTKLSDLPLGK